MRNIKHRTLGLCVMALSVLAPLTSSAQSVRKEFLDIAAAKRDMYRLQMDRERALHYRNWSKVAQDDRLIQSDRFWIDRDRHRIEHAHG